MTRYKAQIMHIMSNLNIIWKRVLNFNLKYCKYNIKVYTFQVLHIRDKPKVLILIYRLF